MKSIIETLEPRRLLTAGGIDPYFGNAGAVTTDSSTVLITSADRIITIARREEGISGRQGWSLTIDRFSADGSPDPTFHIVTPLSTSLLAAGSSGSVLGALDDRGRLFTTVGGRIYCIAPNGTIDRTFGANGIVNTPFTSEIDSMAVINGRLLVGGEQQIGTASAPVDDASVAAGMCAITRQGKRDTTFGPKGVRYFTPFESIDNSFVFRDSRVMSIQADVSGNYLIWLQHNYEDDEQETSDTQVNQDTFVRIKPDGTIDPTLGALEGQTQFSSSISTDFGRTPVQITGTVQPTADRLDSQNRLVVLLNRSNPDDPSFPTEIMRRLPSGAIDTTFAGDGFDQAIVINGQRPTLDAITFDKNDRIVVAAHIGVGTRNQYLVRLNDDGSLDSTFGAGGVLSLGTNRYIESLDTFASGALLSAERDTANFNTTIVHRLWPDDNPQAALSFRNITTATTRPQTLDVTYRDDGSIDLSTLGNRNVGVDVSGRIVYAKYIGLIASSNNNGEVTARYRLAPPGGSWDATDNGVYSVTLRANQVADADGHFAATQSLGLFLVRVRGVVPQSVGGQTTHSSMLPVDFKIDDGAVPAFDDLI